MKRIAVLGLLVLMPCAGWTQTKKEEKGSVTPAVAGAKAEKPDPAVLAEQNRIQHLMGPRTRNLALEEISR